MICGACARSLRFWTTTPWCGWTSRKCRAARAKVGRLLGGFSRFPASAPLKFALHVAELGALDVSEGGLMLAGGVADRSSASVLQVADAAGAARAACVESACAAKWLHNQNAATLKPPVFGEMPAWLGGRRAGARPELWVGTSGSFLGSRRAGTPSCCRTGPFARGPAARVALRSRRGGRPGAPAAVVGGATRAGESHLFLVSLAIDLRAT